MAGILISAALAADKVAAGAAEPFTAPLTLWQWPNDLSLFFRWAAPLGGKTLGGRRQHDQTAGRRVHKVSRPPPLKAAKKNRWSVFYLHPSLFLAFWHFSAWKISIIKSLCFRTNTSSLFKSLKSCGLWILRICLSRSSRNHFFPSYSTQWATAWASPPNSPIQLSLFHFPSFTTSGKQSLLGGSLEMRGDTQAQ